MANIKISELNELQKATDQDLLVIVDVANNETKKIQAGNLGTGGAEIPIGPTPPENPKDGDFWIDTSANGETYGDTLPIGAMVEYNGTTVPQGYEKVSDNNIIESGSNANGNWIKYSDGTMICTQRFEKTINIQTTWGSWYYGYVTCKNYPIAFVGDLPTVSCTVYPKTTSWCFGQLVYSSDGPQTLSNPGSVMCIRPTSQANVDVTVQIIAIGKWK